MTPAQVKEGRSVRLVDPIRFAVRFYSRERGGIVGAGGSLLPRMTIEEPATIASHADAKRRVLIAWNAGDLGAWVDVDTIEPAPPPRDGRDS